MGWDERATYSQSQIWSFCVEWESTFATLRVNLTDLSTIHLEVAHEGPIKPRESKSQGRPRPWDECQSWDWARREIGSPGTIGLPGPMRVWSFSTMPRQWTRRLYSQNGGGYHDYEHQEHKIHHSKERSVRHTESYKSNWIHDWVANVGRRHQRESPHDNPLPWVRIDCPKFNGKSARDWLFKIKQCFWG